jgi:putative multiple sugar transport system ATP-binding protein
MPAHRSQGDRLSDDAFLLEMRGITKTFPGVNALDNVNLAVRPAEIHAVVGENGAGKSTLMKVLSGVYPCDSYAGEIRFDGEPRRFRSIADSEALGIIIIHQELALVPLLSIAENIFLGNETAHRGIIDWGEAWRRTGELLAKVGLKARPTTLVTDLGVGQQQLVEIAKALSKKVRLLILDEPTASLNESDSDALLALLLELKAQGIASILISHKLNEIAKVADAITVLRDGSTVETLDCRAAPIHEDRIIRGMVGRDMAHRYPERSPRIGERVLEVSNWRVHHAQHAEREHIKGVDLHVCRGEIVGIAGLMGAGLVLEEDIRTNISLANLEAVSRAMVIDEGREYQVASDYRRALRIRSADVYQQVVNLSGGNQQKVVLSKWLFAKPELLILDEPTRGIDVGAKYEIYTIVDQLASEGKGILMISSEMPELLGMCDRIYVMNEGRFVAEFPAAEASQERIMRAIVNSGGGIHGQ